MNLLLTILVCIGLSSSVTYTGNYTCRRVRALDSVVHPPPGVNPQALFYNIWSFLQSPKIIPEMLAQSYPRLSDVCFQNLSDHKLSETEYKEVVSEMSRATGVTINEFPEYSTYSNGYGSAYAGSMMNSFNQEFVSMLNKSGNMEPVFKMVKALYLAEYIAGESRHLLGCEGEPIMRKRAADLYAWILSGNQNISKRSRSYGIIQENKDFIIENGEEIVAYSLVQLFLELNRDFEELKSLQLNSYEDKEKMKSIERRLKDLEIDGLMYNGLIYNLTDKEYLREQLQSVRTRIENMFVDERIKNEILIHFPRIP